MSNQAIGGLIAIYSKSVKRLIYPEILVIKPVSLEEKTGFLKTGFSPVL